MRKWMTLFFASALMLMLLASAHGEMISVTELREQVETRGRWTADYTDRYDRKIHVDIEPIMGQYDAVPIILAENPRQFTEENIKNSIHGEQMKNAVTEESEQEGVQCWEYEDDQTGELTHVEAVYTVGVEAVEISVDNTRRKQSDSDIVEESIEDYYCSNEVDWDKRYLGENQITVQEAFDRIFPQIESYFPDYHLDFELIWLDTVVNSRPYYRCIVRQKINDIPVLLGAVDPTLRIQQDLDFERPESWNVEQSFRWGAFFLPWLRLEAYTDGGYFFMASPLKKKSVLIDDVPLCSMDKVIESIETKIQEGYIRNVYALRFGYCCYLNENEEITLYPVWNVECTYIYNPEEGKKYERNMTGVSYVNELNYHTMIVNAQTGKFMNPVEQKEKLLDCPKIITWEDVQ